MLYGMAAKIILKLHTCCCWGVCHSLWYEKFVPEPSGAIWWDCRTAKIALGFAFVKWPNTCQLVYGGQEKWTIAPKPSGKGSEPVMKTAKLRIVVAFSIENANCVSLTCTHSVWTNSPATKQANMLATTLAGVWNKDGTNVRENWIRNHPSRSKPIFL